MKTCNNCKYKKLCSGARHDPKIICDIYKRKITLSDVLFYTLVAIAIYFFFLCLMGCGVESDSPKGWQAGETYEGDFTNTTLFESETSTEIYATVELDYVSFTKYEQAVLFIDGIEYGIFENNKIQYLQPPALGVVDCEIVLYNIVNEKRYELERLVDTLEFYIETFYVQVQFDKGYSKHKLETDSDIELFNTGYPEGSADRCMMFEMRIPHGKTIIFNESINAVTDNNPVFNTILEVHYRNEDFENRNDLYDPPDESMFHVDKEIDKWIMSPVERGHGIHILYVARSVLHDKSFLRVNLTGDFVASANGYYKTLDYESLGYPHD